MFKRIRNIGVAAALGILLSLLLGTASAQAEFCHTDPDTGKLACIETTEPLKPPQKVLVTAPSESTSVGVAFGSSAAGRPNVNSSGSATLVKQGPPGGQSVYSVVIPAVSRGVAFYGPVTVLVGAYYGSGRDSEIAEAQTTMSLKRRVVTHLSFGQRATKIRVKADRRTHLKARFEVVASNGGPAQHLGKRHSNQSLSRGKNTISFPTHLKGCYKQFKYCQLVATVKVKGRVMGRNWVLDEFSKMSSFGAHGQ